MRDDFSCHDGEHMYGTRDVGEASERSDDASKTAAPWDDNPVAYWAWFFNRDLAQLRLTCEARSWPTTEAGIRCAFRRRLLRERLHPDLGGSAAEFRRLLEERDAALLAVRKSHQTGGRTP